jgi:FkbM family methyltransferase
LASLPGKIINKSRFIAKLMRIGAGPFSKLQLLTALLRNDLRRYIGSSIKPFTCRVQAGGRHATVSFTGSVGELMTLVDIFADDNYTPKHDHLHTLFDNQVHTLLDLGANIGLTSIWFTLIYPDISIDAYEPNPAIFPILQKNLAPFPRVRVFERAITGSGGSVTFHQSLHTLESSIFEARDSTDVKVPATTLDQAIETIGGSVDIMKIDIEGAEFDAFAAARLLPQVRVIIGEAHTTQSGHAQEELIELLASYNLVEIYNPNHTPVFGFYAAHTAPR